MYFTSEISDSNRHTLQYYQVITIVSLYGLIVTGFHTGMMADSNMHTSQYHVVTIVRLLSIVKNY